MKMIEIAASTLVTAPREEVFAFLADRQNHWRLTGSSVEVIEIREEEQDRLRGALIIRGPLGLRRKVHTRVLSAREPCSLAGVAEVGERTRADVKWELRDQGEETHVALSARVKAAGWMDRILLLAGGALWMRRVFRGTLALLAQQLRAAQTVTVADLEAA